jgi:hypothetical protein
MVAHWVILDRKALPPTRKLGESCRLSVVAFDDYPALQKERLVMTQLDLHLPLYYGTDR